MSEVIDKSKMSQQQSQLLARIEHQLIAPCCYTQTIDLHLSDIAEKMRHDVAAMILGGQKEKEIYDYYKNLYGGRILAVPDGALGVAAFAIPTTVSGLAAGALAFFLYRLHRRKAALTPTELRTKVGLSSHPSSDESRALSRCGPNLSHPVG